MFKSCHIISLPLIPINSRIMDAFGNAALDFLNNDHDEFIYVESKTMEDDVIPVEHLFRSLDQMPDCEQKAIEITKGKVLVKEPPCC